MRDMQVNSDSSRSKPRDRKWKWRTLVCFAAILLIHVNSSLAVGDAPTRLEFFDSKVEPLLRKRCFSCHSHAAGKAKGGLVLDSRIGWEKGGGSGPAIVPGNVEDSLLIQGLRYDGLEMPPNARLNPEEIKIFEKWIEDGAFDERKSQSPEVDARALWALEPIQKYEPPKTLDEYWPIDEADQFILSEMESRGIQPNGPSDKYRLLRRVTFDLTGLPPTRDEIKAFLADDSAEAYHKVVKRLLNSKAYGQHWARHWFDLSCYADVQGNTLIGEAWRYRDYVIAAFNSDKPVDRFILEQIAGDHLPFETVQQQRELIIATGYLSIGPWVIQNYIKPQLRADIVDHQIDRIGRTFLGQTISCARCHDHKFDPIPTKDYYALAGIFHSTATTDHTGPGVWSSILERELPKLPVDENQALERKQMLSKLQSALRAKQVEIMSWYRQFPEASNTNVLTQQHPVLPNQPGTTYEVAFEVGPTAWAAAEQATGTDDGIWIELIKSDGSLHSSERVNIPAWDGSKTAQTFAARSFAYKGDGEGELRLRIISAQPGSGRFAGAIDELVVSVDEDILYRESFDEITAAPINGLQADTGLAVLAQAVIPDWIGGGLNHSHMVERDEGNFALQLFSGNQSTFANVQATQAQQADLAAAKGVQTEIDTLQLKLRGFKEESQTEYAMSATDVNDPSDTRIYRRGDFKSLGESVSRGVLGAVGDGDAVSVPDGTSGRLQLAEWLVSSNNSLTSRVLVNRVWHHLFGTGIVPTVDYFGIHGERPTHPELLDFLADRFRDENKWSLKLTIEQLVLSRTYQMSSLSNSEAIQVDPDNRYYWRMPRRRLSGESMRDSMLFISGKLDRASGGSPLGLELEGNIRGAGGNVNPPTWGGKVPDYVRNRRTIYQPFKRERPVGDLEILSIFDFPHPNDITGARATTTVATQALFLLNSPFVKEQAKLLNERLAAEVPSDEASRLNELYLLVLNRPADKKETELALAFLDALAPPNKEEDVNEPLRKVAWEQLCHGILVSNSFLFKE